MTTPAHARLELAKRNARISIGKLIEKQLDSLEDALEDAAMDAMVDAGFDPIGTDEELPDSIPGKLDEMMGMLVDVMDDALRSWYIEQIGSLFVTVQPLHLLGRSYDVEIYSERPKFDDPELCVNFPDYMGVYEGNINGGDTRVHKEKF